MLGEKSTAFKENRFLMGSEVEYSFQVASCPVKFEYTNFYDELLTELIQLSDKISFLRPKNEKWSRLPDAQFDEKWKSEEETVSSYISYIGRILFNGGRLYIDSQHPEYSTPEVTNPRDLVLFEKAGELVVKRAAQELASRHNIKIFVHKNNSDGKGNSYGYHVNYLLSRDSFDEIFKKENKWSAVFSDAARRWVTFLVTAAIYNGSGKVGAENGMPQCAYQISQRADFFMSFSSHETMVYRGLLNMRDESHANPQFFGRFHVIFNDANMSEWQTYLKIGSQALFLKMLEYGSKESLERLPILKNPLAVLPIISRDLEMKAKLACEDGIDRTALEIQKICLETMQNYCDANYYGDNWKKQCLSDLDEVLKGLGEDINGLRDRIDWIAKKTVIDEYQSRKGIQGDIKNARALDVNYHNLNQGIYHMLVSEGKMRKLFTNEEIEQAVLNPPTDTRAYLRGFLVKNYPRLLADVDWNFLDLKLKMGGRRFNVPFRDLHPWDLNKEFVDKYLVANDSRAQFTMSLLSLVLKNGVIISPLASAWIYPSHYPVYRYRSRYDDVY